ncbi:EGF domain-specific O-linked N-acetylglucosamine transferase-like isoform X1 [Branchiostoma floridae]|uniref:EGF domain-specific O-linked N-acetylglucosamine transferase n=1 Tax=Branchiostoma floridae TaxID=7739 RepID=A0A9J7MS07_BRAFL|nr:EGF domain-specific O-linked N-acetylglucosamine transferase-like isoform X1 [Branchiostoma floridae]
MPLPGPSHNDVTTQPICPALAHLRLPPEHLPYHLYSHPEAAAAVRNDTRCYRRRRARLPCWGYEEDCPPESRYSPPVCDRERESRKRHHKLSNTERFWLEAGFGYVREQKRQLVALCEAQSQNDSWLECSPYARYCRARNLYLDFRRLRIQENHFGKRFRRDILGPGDIGGHCKVKADRLKSMTGHEAHGLMSWYAELENFTSLNFRPTTGNENCDVMLDTPTYFMKLDLGINMYHHFCDFLNLYVSQHVNGSFSTDVNIVVWDTSGRSYKDLFGATWRAFTDHSIQQLKDYDGKRVCVREAIFPLLPRMAFGLYYNIHLVPGCKNSGLVRAFSRHVLYRLGIDHGQPQIGRLRVTFLSRITQFRRVLNEDQLLSELRKDSRLHVNKVDYDHREMPFLQQLQHTQNTDIFIGIHGAGLTHTLFLPDWACLLEIYNCGDESCYRNLAALRGVGYVTWEGNAGLTQIDQLGTYKGRGDYDKFVNYTVNPTEFRVLMEKAITYVFNHPAFPARHMHQKEEL